MILTIRLNPFKGAGGQNPKDGCHAMRVKKIIEVLKKSARINVTAAELERYDADAAFGEHLGATREHL